MLLRPSIEWCVCVWAKTSYRLLQLCYRCAGLESTVAQAVEREGIFTNTIAYRACHCTAITNGNRYSAFCLARL